MLHLLHILTAVLVGLKLAEVTAVATLSWWVVITPSILALIIPVIIVVFGFIFLMLFMKK